MSINQPVTSLNTSKRLKELGFEKPSEFYWVDGSAIKTEIISAVNKHLYTYLNGAPLAGTMLFPAYLLSELLEVLPEKIETEDECSTLILSKVDNEYGIAYPSIYWFFDKNPAEAAGLLVIKLIEEGYIKVGTSQVQLG